MMNLRAGYLALAATLLLCAPDLAQQPNAAPTPLAAQTLPMIPAPSPDSTVTLTVDTGKQEQHILGFGTAIAYYQNWVAGNPHSQEVYDALFKGLNLSILRLRNVYLGDPKSNFASDQMNIVQGITKALGRKPTILMTSWAPPKELKSNGSQENGGTLIKINGQFAYDKYAQYWADSLAAYRAHGIVPDWVSIQNEPDFTATWESCVFRPVEETQKGVEYAGYDKALDAVYNKLQNGPDDPLLIGPECIGIGYGTPELYINSNNTVEEKELYAVAHHLYHGGSVQNPDSFVPAMNRVRDDYKGVLPVMATELDLGNMFQTAWVICNTMTQENAVTYLFWGGIWHNSNSFIEVEDPTKQSTWKYPHGWHISDTYYAMKHFSYFTKPGDIRVDASSSNTVVKIAAFLQPNHKRLTLVLLNTSPTDSQTASLELNGFSPKTSEVYETAGTQRFADIGPVPAGSSLNLPPQSIATVVFRR